MVPDDRRRSFPTREANDKERRKRIAEVRLPDGSVKWAEIHCFEAHGIGRKNIKVKYYLGK